MKPKEYFNIMVEPTVVEFEQNPASVRHAFLACVCCYHFSDAAAHHVNREAYEVANELTTIASSFQVVRDTAIMAKHIELDPKRSANIGRPLPNIEDTKKGASAPYIGGIYYKGGVGYSGSDRVVRVKYESGQYHDLRFCVREARRAIEEYLQRPDMQ